MEINPLVRGNPAPCSQAIPEEEGGSEWQGPAKLGIETMVWDLPLTLYPTYPNHAAQASQLPSRHTGPA